MAAQFPDGQLYVNLRGFDPDRHALEPGEAVRGFLDAFGIPVARIPAGLPAQAALYRSLLAGKRVLVVLDNARDVEQVRPLLPGSSGCLAIVTSRNHLTGLVVTEGAYPLTLNVLTAAEAMDLLALRLGASRVGSEPNTVEDIVAACARLPLALTVVAARAANYPSFPLAAFASELHEATGTLEPPATAEGALGWFRAEHATLLAAVRVAAEAGFGTRTWRLAWALNTFLLRRGLWNDQTTVWNAGLDAARRIGDTAGEAHALHGLAIGC